MGKTPRHASVIAGLDPTIHRVKRTFESLVDARVKPAHDGPEIGDTP